MNIIHPPPVAPLLHDVHCACLQLTLQELLQAAGVGSLEKMSDIVDARGRSFRQRGCILRVNIFYHNWQDTWIGTRYESCCVK